MATNTKVFRSTIHYLLTTLGTEYRFTRAHDVSSTPLKTNTATTKPITTTSAGASTTTITQSLQKTQISTTTPIHVSRYFSFSQLDYLINIIFNSTEHKYSNNNTNNDHISRNNNNCNTVVANTYTTKSTNINISNTNNTLMSLIQFLTHRVPN